MPLTKEQLLQKRFKFISPYPGGHWEIGEVFEPCGKNCYATCGMYMIIMHGSILEAYPHIFQPLPWWSDRNIEDMPEYLKQHGMIDSRGNAIPDKVVKVSKHWANTATHPHGNYKVFSSSETPHTQLYSQMYFDWDPATEEEYTAYINKTTINHD
jgi:hypothetical protein